MDFSSSLNVADTMPTKYKTKYKDTMPTNDAHRYTDSTNILYCLYTVTLERRVTHTYSTISSLGKARESIDIGTAGSKLVRRTVKRTCALGAAGACSTLKCVHVIMSSCAAAQLR